MKQQPVKHILITALAIFVALATGGAVLAATSGPRFEDPVIPPVEVGEQVGEGGSVASTNCRTTFTSGAGIDLFDWCFSDDGNIARIEHSDGLEHVSTGTLYEGWCVSANGTKRGQTTGSDANIGLEPAVYPNPSAVRHRTTDNSLSVLARFAENTKDKEIIIRLSVKNITGVVLNNVLLTRFVDADMSNTTGGDVWTSATRTVSVSQPGSSVLQLSPRSMNFNALSMIFDTFEPTLDEDCYNATADTTLEATAGDRSMAVLYQLGNIFPGQTKTVQFVYRIGI